MNQIVYVPEQEPNYHVTLSQEQVARIKARLKTPERHWMLHEALGGVQTDKAPKAGREFETLKKEFEQYQFDGSSLLKDQQQAQGEFITSLRYTNYKNAKAAYVERLRMRLWNMQVGSPDWDRREDLEVAYYLATHSFDPFLT